MLRRIYNKIKNLPFKNKTLVARNFNSFRKKKHTNKISKLFHLLYFFVKSKVYKNDWQGLNKLFTKAKLNFSKDDYFIYSIDVYKGLLNKNRIVDNCSPDYTTFIDCGLRNMRSSSNDIFSININNTTNTISKFIERLINRVQHSRNPRKNYIKKYLLNFLSGPATTTEEALQRLLIINSLFWQTGHTLIGVGRLDMLLDRFLIDETRSDNELIDLFSNFILTLHKYYDFKSSTLIGDTGQLIILGGKKENGEYFCNRYTYLIIKAIQKCHLPDPKVLLRVSSKTKDDLFRLALECMSTGIGSPLFSNDEVVIKSLIEFGYDRCDAFSYTTSACWEIIPGSCYEQNNLCDINFLSPFHLMDTFEPTDSLVTYDDFLDAYIRQLKNHVNWVASTLRNQKWEYDPLLTLTCKHCIFTKKDISECGGKYNNYGILSVGLANAINSILNIKKIVYEDKIMSYNDINFMRLENFRIEPTIVDYFKTSNISRFGEDKTDVISLTNKIIKTVSTVLKNRKNNLGDGFKFGLSSPNYIMGSYGYPASFDGRIDGSPFVTHISNDRCGSYTEIINFVSSLEHLPNCFNGNVIDLIISPILLEKNIDKMIVFIKQSIKKGFFQMQFNVVSSDILIKAKNNPKLMPNLIVRVWGFSAYFNDLPVEYKDLLIKRALENEHKSI